MGPRVQLWMAAPVCTPCCQQRCSHLERSRPRAGGWWGKCNFMGWGWRGVCSALLLGEAFLGLSKCSWPVMPLHRLNGDTRNTLRNRIGCMLILMMGQWWQGVRGHIFIYLCPLPVQSSAQQAEWLDSNVGVSLLGFEFQLLHLRAMCSWESCLTHLCLYFLIGDKSNSGPRMRGWLWGVMKVMHLLFTMSRRNLFPSWTHSAHAHSLPFTHQMFF